MFQFHREHGQNISLSKDMLVATRTQSFANALVFSQRPLEENEVFLIEITGNEKGWAGHLRCGITLHNPAVITIPQYLLPDLYQLGKSCVFSIKPSKTDPFNDLELPEKRDENKSHCKYFDPIKKCPVSHTVNEDLITKEININPCEIGSCIGFFISAQRELFFIINGEQYGPCAGKIPLQTDVYAALDLYGMTSQIRIINCCVPRLTTLCKHIVTVYYDYDKINYENIPKCLKKQILRMCGRKASSTDLQASSADLQATSSDLKATSSDLKATSTELKATSTDLEASSDDLEDTSTEPKVSSTDLKASCDGLEASSSNLKATSTDLKASYTDLEASSCTDLKAPTSSKKTKLDDSSHIEM